ncbi:redoxin family protein [Shewanella sp. SP2S2-6]|uniref:TlpA family protein disulfide reductase n=1 Tax=Shewanella TaxID=22 RepID=UPI00288E6130|nr:MULTISPECIES: redoxin family protein [unclassified Shewanella]MDT3295992.1 redoxin family protein [Shewanella sp. SP2S2-6]MDT3307022.1 redoxin family protein [Shewanella sp. SP1S1-4]
MLLRQIIVMCLAVVSFATFAGDKAYQDIALKTYPDQQQVTLASVAGNKPIYLKFWATWCQPCMEQMPHFEALQKKYQDKINIDAVNININEEQPKIADVIARFGLTMPVWLDNEGELGVALGLVGTPYSVLINRAGDVVYTSHESDANLDKFIDMLANGQELTAQTTEAPSAEQTAKLLKPWEQGEHLLFFTATWCDWYLAESRPEMSKECIAVQKGLNNLAQKVPNKAWHGVVNHLWTDDKALEDFKQLYQTKIDFSIDELGVLFNHFKIRNIPTLLWVKDGKVIQRITDFSQPEQLVKQLSAQ